MESATNITAKQTHCGQHRRYRDFYKEWDIQTDCKDTNAVLEYCFTNLQTRRIPESSEWHRKIRNGGEEFGNANYYFAGYYTLTQTRDGYKFVVCEPSTDQGGLRCITNF